MKKFVLIFLCFLFCVLPLTACKKNSDESTLHEKFSDSIFGKFDTAIVVMSYQKDKEAFDKLMDFATKRYTELNNLFDIYNSYEGLNNIKTINDNAGKQPVEVSQDIIDLLDFSIEWHKKTNGAVNIAMGSVLKIWHDVRSLDNPTDIEIPSIEALQDANRHTDISNVEIDKEAMTVFLKDSEMSLDVGAVAKGYATEIIALELSKTYDNFAISAGGNVRAHGAPKDGRTRWGVGIQNPALDEDFKMVGGNTDLAYIKGDQSIVCSGGYQRFFVKDGIKYHHLINPQTLFPENYYQGVTILCKNSGVADALSTAVFMMTSDDALAFTNSIEGVECILVLANGEIIKSDGFDSYLKSAGINSQTP